MSVPLIEPVTTCVSTLREASSVSAIEATFCMASLIVGMWMNAASIRGAAALAASTPQAAISVPARQARAASTGTERIAQSQ